MGLTEKHNEKISIEDIYSLPDGKRAELIDGDMYMMAPPSWTHQKLLLSIGRQIADYIDERGGECEVAIAPFAVFLNEDEIDYVEPDISVICDKAKLSEKGCSGAPDWIIEIVSPSSRRMDYMIKLFKYKSVGVREYWIVDPAESCVTVYNFVNNDMAKYGFCDTMKSGIYDDMMIELPKLG